MAKKSVHRPVYTQRAQDPKLQNKGAKKLDSKVVQKDIDSTGVTVVAKLRAWKFGVACGIVSALAVALVTLVGIYGYFLEFNALIVSGYGFFSYSTSPVGVLIGAVCGFVDGFVGGFIIAWVYNKLL